MDESLVKYSKLSIITATNRFSIWTGDKQEEKREVTDQFGTEKRLWGIAVAAQGDPSTSASCLSPGRSWRTWRRQSRSRQIRSRSPPRGPTPAPQGPSHTSGPPDRTTWSPATILPWRSCTWKHRTAWGGTWLEDCSPAARSLVRKTPPAIGKVWSKHQRQLLTYSYFLRIESNSCEKWIHTLLGNFLGFR